MESGNRLVYGVGINDADCTIQSIDHTTGLKKTCPFYRRWICMLQRCYSEKFQEKRPTYKGCTVCKEWLTFSNFKAWMEGQDWKGKQLDKDLLVDGNKVYSPETCVFVHGVLNSFILDNGICKGDHMVGVYFDKSRNKFKSQCSNPITKRLEYLGRFSSEIEAHLKWRSRKLELVDLMQQEGYIYEDHVYEALKLKYS